MLGGSGGRRRRGRGWDGWMASLTWWARVWVNSGSLWWTGRPGVLQFMGSQRVGHDWVTELGGKHGQFFRKSFAYPNSTEAKKEAIAREVRSRWWFYSRKNTSMRKCTDGRDLLDREKLLVSEQRAELMELCSWTGDAIDQYFPSLGVCQDPLEGLWQYPLLILSPPSQFLILRCSLRVCISKFPGHTDAAVLRAMLLELGLSRRGLLTLTGVPPLVCSNRFIH